jgi:hypothetical protein
LAATKAPTPLPSPELQIYMDDAMPHGTQRMIGGTVENISSRPLTSLIVEIQLTRRKESSTETRSIPLQPPNLAPAEQGKYSLAVLAQDYSAVKLLRVRSADGGGDVPFKTAPGAKRPPERVPTPTIIVKRPSSRRSGGEEFLNGPDDPGRVR